MRLWLHSLCWDQCAALFFFACPQEVEVAVVVTHTIMCFRLALPDAATQSRVTASHPNSEVKLDLVWVVLWWGTTWEGQMLHLFLSAFFAARAVVPSPSFFQSCACLKTFIICSFRIITDRWAVSSQVVSNMALHLNAAKCYQMSGMTVDLEGRQDQEVMREAGVFWKELGMCSKINSAVAEVREEHKANIPKWNAWDIGRFIRPSPSHQHRCVPCEHRGRLFDP